MFRPMQYLGCAIMAGFVISLAGCGGGGGSGAAANTTAPAAAPLPTSGVYAYALKAQGSVSAPTLGLSLVHPSAPGIEFQIEPASAGVADVKVVSSGTVTVSSATVSAIQPYSLLYIVGGDVRRLPLVANGVAPSAQISKAGSTTACKFLFDANDYATPTNSRYIVSTAGADGVCGTADDGQAEVTLDTTGGVHFASPTAFATVGSAIGAVRDPGTLAPSGWLLNYDIYFWNPTSLFVLPNGITKVGATAIPLTNVVVQTYQSAVVQYNNQLTVISNFGSVSNNTTVINLDPTITAGANWQSIGFDANNFYVYRNSGTTTTSTWTVLKISRTSPAATLLATGNGLIGAANMGTNLLYVTVLGANSNSLQTVSKTTAGVPQLFLSGTTSSLATVLTSNSGVHQLWQLSGINSGTPSYVIKMIDELGNVLYTSTSAFPMVEMDAATLNLNQSENRSRFVFATGYGAQQFNGATLVAYDTALQTAATLGTLPGSTTFGSNPVFASLTSSSTNFMAGFAASVTSGSVQTSGATLFSINPTTPSSLQLTTSTQ